MLKVEELTKVYPDSGSRGVKAVSEVSFSIKKGQIVGLLGPNGAGKTTIIKCISSLIEPTDGRIHVGGYDINENKSEALARMSSVLEGNRNIYWRLTPRENMEFFIGLQGHSQRKKTNHIDHLIKVLGLADKSSTTARKLSRGMQQKLALGCALVKDPQLLLLDEPTLGLDVEASLDVRERIKKLARQEGRTVLLSSHNMNVVQDLCERVIIINRGEVVVDDKVENLLRLFRAKSYRIQLEGKLENRQKELLTEGFELIKIKTVSDNFTTITVELDDSTKLYRLIDMLKGAQIPIASIDKKDPDLEEVFLKIIKGES